MSTNTESNEFLYFIVGGLVVVALVFGYMHFYKGGSPDQTRVNLNITEDGIKGSVTPPTR